jgi:hypothetical protein
MTRGVLPLLGVKIIASPLMVDQVHVGTWLNGYRASRHRSRRVSKKLLRGSRKRQPIIGPMIESVPKREMYQLPTGEIVGHPATIAEVKRQMDAMGSMLGIGR